MGSLDRPDEPGRAEQVDARGPDRPTPKPRELPDSDERGRAYEAMLAHFSGKTTTEASPGQQPDGTQRRSYQAEVPRHLDTWADHERRWPPRPRAVMDRPADPVASDDAVAWVQEAEPRFSADAQAIEQENKDKYGGWLAGFEHRLKGEDRGVGAVGQGGLRPAGNVGLPASHCAPHPAAVCVRARRREDQQIVTSLDGTMVTGNGIAARLRHVLHILDGEHPVPARPTSRSSFAFRWSKRMTAVDGKFAEAGARRWENG